MKALLIFAASAALAQNPQPPAKNASISGVVKDSGTGQPLADYVVSTSVNAKWAGNTIIMSPETRTVQSTTDQQGRYRLADLPPGDYRLSARSAGRFGDQVTRHIGLASRDIEGVDFRIVVDGIISGKVIDENKEPVPNLWVMAIAREYYLGNLGYFPRKIARTNDRGEYKIPNVPAGSPFLLMAERRPQSIPARSDVPLDPKLRRRVPMRTWYPNTPDKEGATAIVLRPGEHRERVDIDIRKSVSYCANGVLEGPRGPAAVRFSIEALQPSSGSSGSGGMYMMAPGGTTAEDGKFRICDLSPGSYRLSVNEDEGAFFAAVVVTIADRDVHNLKAAASVGMPLEGEVVWDGEAPSVPETAKVAVFLHPLLRAPYRSELSDARVSIPGTFRFPSMLLDDYSVRVTLNAPGLYIKDVTYGGHSVQYDALRFGSAMPGAGLRVVIGRDGATIGARVADKDGNPVPDQKIVIMPGEFRSDGALASMLVTGRTDQYGGYTSQTLAPGRYYILATEDTIDAAPENIAKLWRSRDRFNLVELAPKGAQQVTLEPVRLE